MRGKGEQDFIQSLCILIYLGSKRLKGKKKEYGEFCFPQVLNKSQSSQLKGLEALHNAEASEVMKRLEQESKVEIAFLFGFDFCILLLFWGANYRLIKSHCANIRSGGGAYVDLQL